MKYLCPKCLMYERHRLHACGRSTRTIDRILSIVCNAAPVGPRAGDPCCCGEDWIPLVGVGLSDTPEFGA